MTKFNKASATVNGAKPYPSGLRFIILCVLAVCCFLSLPFLMAGGVIVKAVLVALPEGQKRSGKSGTVVWLRNNIMRVNFFPAVVRNIYTTGVRARLASWSSGWNNLTQPQQDSWLYSKIPSGSNRLGQPLLASGKDAYVKCNFNLETISVAPITTAPTPVAVPPPTLTAVTADAATTKISPTGPVTSVDTTYIFWATNRVSPGTNSPGRNRYRIIYVTDTIGAPTPTAIWGAYAAKYGALIATDTFFFKMTQISKTTGQQSIDTQVYKVVTT